MASFLALVRTRPKESNLQFLEVIADQVAIVLAFEDVVCPVFPPMGVPDAEKFYIEQQL